MLGEELSALQQLIDCMVKDLAQSAILVNYITDFIKKKTVKEEWNLKLCDITDSLVIIKRLNCDCLKKIDCIYHIDRII